MATIVLVDDDEVSLTFANAVLSANGHKVVTFSSPHPVLDYLKTQYVNLIILDVQMPGGISGFDLLESIRKLEELKPIPVAMLTGRFQEEEDVKLAKKLGANDYILKPLDPDLFIKKIQKLLRPPPL